MTTPRPTRAMLLGTSLAAIAALASPSAEVVDAPEPEPPLPLREDHFRLPRRKPIRVRVSVETNGVTNATLAVIGKAILAKKKIARTAVRWHRDEAKDDFGHLQELAGELQLMLDRNEYAGAERKELVVKLRRVRSRLAKLKARGVR